MEELETFKPTSPPSMNLLRPEHVQSYDTNYQDANTVKKTRIDHKMYLMTGPKCGSMDSEVLFCDMVFQDDYADRVQFFKNLITYVLLNEGFYIGEEFCGIKTEDKVLLENLSTTFN